MRKKRKIINLYNDETTFNIKHVISISKEDDLNSFWEYTNPLYPLINPLITQFYNFALSYFKDNETVFFEIIIEESHVDYYFTLWNKDAAQSFEKCLMKTSFDYLLISE